MRSTPPRHLVPAAARRPRRQLLFVVISLGLAATFTAAGGWSGLAGRDTFDEGGDRGDETAMKVVPSVPAWDPTRDTGGNRGGTAPATTPTTGAGAARGAVLLAAAGGPAGATGATTLSSVSLLPGPSAPPAGTWRPKLLDHAGAGPPTATTAAPAATLAAPVTTAAAAPSAAPTTTAVAQAPEPAPTTTTSEATTAPTTTTTEAPASAATKLAPG